MDDAYVRFLHRLGNTIGTVYRTYEVCLESHSLTYFVVFNREMCHHFISFPSLWNTDESLSACVLWLHIHLCIN